MIKLNTALLTLAVIVTTQGCSAPYFGHTKEQWDNLSLKEKMIVKEEYQTVIDLKNDQSHTDKINERSQSIINYSPRDNKRLNNKFYNRI